MVKLKVLLIEDDEVARLSLKRVIDKEGYETLTAVDGYEGLNLFRSEKPDIVITDIKMPNIDGTEVVHTVKDISPSTEIILVTGHGDYDTAILALRDGVLDYLKKPVDLDQLIFALERAGARIAEREKIEVKIRLLILDDDKSTNNKLARVFEEEGYDVFTGLDGEEGLKIFSLNKIDILITDIRMPKKDGIKVLHEVKKISKDCEVIMLTGYGDESTAIQAMRDGAINYIRKPIDLDQLILAVQKAIDKLRLKRAYLYKVREMELAQQIIAKITEGKEIVVELRDRSRVKTWGFALILINTVPIPIVLLDRDMNVDFANKYFVLLYGYTPKQVEDNFIEKTGLKHIRIEKIRENVQKALEAKEPEIISMGEQNKIVMTKVSLMTDEGKRERVVVLIGKAG